MKKKSNKNKLTQKQTNKQTHRQTDKLPGRPMPTNVHIIIKKQKQKNNQMKKLRENQTKNKPTQKQTNKQTHRQTDKQTNRQTTWSPDANKRARKSCFAGRRDELLLPEK